jgi:hypothetical protein
VKILYFDMVSGFEIKIGGFKTTCKLKGIYIYVTQLYKLLIIDIKFMNGKIEEA